MKMNDYNRIPDENSLYRLMYSVPDLSRSLATIEKEYMSGLINEKGKSDLKFILEYFTDQAEPDFKDIPLEHINKSIDIVLENEFKELNINFSKEKTDNFTDYVIEILEKKDDIYTKYNLKYKKLKWRHEKIYVIPLDVYTKPGFIIVKDKPNFLP